MSIRVASVANKMPPLTGRPIRVEMRPSLGPHLAASSIPKRLILLDVEVLTRRGDFERILIHEIFHFVWVSLGNPRRREWENLLAAEISAGVRGELGWSAEWRKGKLPVGWRRYICESFCDSAAWLWSGLALHDEFTLASPARRARKKWLEQELSIGPVRI